MLDTRGKLVSHLMKFLTLLGLVFFGLGTASASLVFEGIALGGGAGIGTLNIVLTIQKNPTESGCVGWNGSADVIGSAACPQNFATPVTLTPVIPGGNEKTGSSQTQTRTILQTGVTSAADLRVVLNVGEPAGNSFTVENISLTIYSTTGTVLFNSGNTTGVPITLNESFQGQGNLGFTFKLDAAQAAIAQTFFSNTANRIGIAGLLSGVAGSNETFSIASSTAFPLETPEPTTTLSMVSGLAGLAIAARLQRRRSRPAQ